MGYPAIPDSSRSTIEQLVEAVPDAILGVDGKRRIAFLHGPTEDLFG